LTSSPVIFVNEGSESEPTTQSDYSSVTNRLFHGANISVEDFVQQFTDIATKHCISDSASNSYLNLFILY